MMFHAKVMLNFDLMHSPWLFISLIVYHHLSYMENLLLSFYTTWFQIMQILNCLGVLFFHISMIMHLTNWHLAVVHVFLWDIVEITRVFGITILPPPKSLSHGTPNLLKMSFNLLKLMPQHFSPNLSSLPSMSLLFLIAHQDKNHILTHLYQIPPRISNLSFTVHV